MGSKTNKQTNKHKEQELPFFRIQSQSEKGNCQIRLRVVGAEVVSDGH
jgi:hypothetical protein